MDLERSNVDMKMYRNKDNLTEKELLKAVKASRAGDTGKVEEDLESRWTRFSL